MKKRVIALALCLVMLLTGLGMSGDMIDSLVSDPAETPAPVETTVPADAEPVDDVPVTSAQANIDVAAIKKRLFACGSYTEAETFAASLSEEEATALMEQVSEAEIRAFAAKLNIDLEEEAVTPPVNYTEVGPLMPAVSVNNSVRTKRAAAKQAEDDNGLILNKSATYDSETNMAKITLEAYTTGKVTTSSKSTPVDVVLVLDESGSMADKINQYDKVYELDTKNDYYVKNGDSYVKVSWCEYHYNYNFSKNPGWYSGIHFIFHWGKRYDPMTDPSDTDSDHVQFYQASQSTTTKRDALIKAASDFADKVYNDANTNSVDHRMSVIGFSNDKKSVTKVGLEADIRDNITSVEEAISKLNADGGTYIEDGLTNACAVFDKAATTSATERKRVVVVFTDGIPGDGEWSSTEASNSANSAISKAYDLKNTYNATVYAIGMLEDANPELEISNENNDSAKTNKFLHYLSSNYPKAQSMSNGGSGSNKGYYLSASDTASLSAIFTKISEEIATPSIPLGSSAVIKDVIAPAFEVPADVSNIKLYTSEYDGSNFGTRKEATGVTATIEGDTVNITGFDYNANFVSDKQHDGTFGKKLIIEFTVSCKDGFLGGNNVFTNGEKSGLYENKDAESAIENFTQPQVNVPIAAVVASAENKNVYLLSNMSKDELLSGADIKVGNVPLDLTKADFGLENWRTQYVNISVEIKDANGNVVNNLNALTNDQNYTVSVTVAPKTNGDGANGTAATAKTGTDTAAIKIFYPEITFKDSEIELGQTPEYEDNRVSVAWKHGDTDSKKVTMTGAPPMLTYEYAPSADAFKTDTYVNVEVFVGTEKKKLLDNEVTFKHEWCNVEGSDFDPQKGEFIVHIKTFNLTITKEITGNYGTQYGNRDFIFNVKCEKNKIDMNVVVTVDKDKGSGSVTIKGLPVGTYTITEDISWSWRYELKSVTINGNQETANENPVTYTPESGAENNIIFTNQLENTKWLSFVDSVKNFFGMKDKP